MDSWTPTEKKPVVVGLLMGAIFAALVFPLLQWARRARLVRYLDLLLVITWSMLLAYALEDAAHAPKFPNDQHFEMLRRAYARRSWYLVLVHTLGAILLGFVLLYRLGRGADDE